MGKPKTTGKKTKAVTSKKNSASKTTSHKPIKLGGVPNQGTVLQQEELQ